MKKLRDWTEEEINAECNAHGVCSGCKLSRPRNDGKSHLCMANYVRAAYIDEPGG